MRDYYLGVTLVFWPRDEMSESVRIVPRLKRRGLECNRPANRPSPSPDTRQDTRGRSWSMVDGTQH